MLLVWGSATAIDAVRVETGVSRAGLPVVRFPQSEALAC